MFRTLSLAAVALVAALLIAAPVAAHGQATHCNGALNGGTYDGIHVPAGAWCVLRGVTVNGTVTVDESAGLVVYEAVRKGQIPSIRIGKRVLVPRAALELLLRGGR